MLIYIEALFWKIFSSTHIAKKCGHQTKRTGLVRAFGRKVITTMPKSPDYCLGCIAEMARKCGKCGGAIFIGDPVAVTELGSGPLCLSILGPPGDTRCMVTCMRRGCVDTAACRSGFWVPPGMVEHTPSPFEMALRSPDCTMVRLRNASDYSDQGEVVEA